ncbi:MAG: carboxymuconolactone decarboxylase family protein [Bdellovibrionaceae bacterium]|jgi:AhpD family alkylhydroperoxidase|nr:carboxymuconolactone decarboxylase family protein [Pseudobdellovibrionaceae bacterium]
MYVEAKKISEYPFYLRYFFRSQEKKIGQILLPGLLWGRVPFLQVLFLWFWGHLDRKSSSLDPALRALVQVRVAQLNWCAFCIDYNAMNLLTRTDSIDKVDVLEEWETHSLFSQLERDVLHYVGIVSGANVKVPTELMGKLKSHFSDDQVVELTALISFQNMSAKFNAALDIPSQGMCKVPTV